MLHQALQFVTGTALTEGEFCRELLLSPGKAVSDFDLTDEERAVITSIRADCLEDFADKLHRWISEQQGISPDSPPHCFNGSLLSAPWPAACLLWRG